MGAMSERGQRMSFNQLAMMRLLNFSFLLHPLLFHRQAAGNNGSA
jgi:hypothetical protein